MECEDAFAFDDLRQKTELDVMRLVNTPDAWKIRAFKERGKKDRKTYFMNMPDKT